MSIRRLVKKGRLAASADGTIPTAAELTILSNIPNLLFDPATINVHLGGVEENFKAAVEGRELWPPKWIEVLPRIVPPFKQMWLEWVWDRSCFGMPNLPVGFLVLRLHEDDEGFRGTPGSSEPTWGRRGAAEVRATWHVTVVILVEEDGIVHGQHGVVQLELDEEGKPFRWYASSRGPISEPQWVDLFSRVVMESLAIMNCNNVQVVPEDQPRTRARRRFKQEQFIVWHELLVTDRRRVRRAGAAGGSPRGAVSSFRLHQVRGHWEDHTEKGLFGNPNIKGVFWFSEHEKGDLQHGVVMKEYRVESAVGEVPADKPER